MTNGAEAEAWLPGMESHGGEDRKPKQRREKRRMTKDVVPLDIELVPGFTMRVFATVSKENRRRDGK